MTRTLSSALMITGTCVGAGMLALPIAGAEIGLLPSLFVMIVAWAFMTTTGLFYMEAARWFEQGAHLGQMTQALLGRGGRFTASFIYLFIAYASLVAYQVEGGKVMLASLSIEGLTISKHFIEVCLFAALFSCVLVLGANFIKRLNSILVILMCTLYIAILYFTLPYFDPSLALRQNWDIKAICQFFPLMLTSFSFPGIVPALVLPLGGDVKKMRLAILLGTTSAFLFYATWMAAVMGCVELDGNWGLRAARLNDRGASAVLMHLVGQPLLKYAAQAFSFMAIATSFLGISWGLIYFFADALKIKLGLDYSFANELEIADGKLTGFVTGTIVNANQKAILVKLIAQQENISLEQVVAIGDGANDLPMLATAGLGIAFHAKDVVRKEAQQHLSHGPMTSILYFLGIPGPGPTNL